MTKIGITRMFSIVVLTCTVVGCTTALYTGKPRSFSFPCVDRTWRVRIETYYLHNPDAGHRGRLDAGDVARLHRLRDGTATEDEWYSWPFTVPEHGTTAEVREENQIEEIVALVREGVATATADPYPGWLGGELALIYLEWSRGSRVSGFLLIWRDEDWFLVNPGQPNAQCFRSEELAAKLADLIATQAIRTTYWSNPELEHPEVPPQWYLERCREPNRGPEAGQE